MSKQIQQSACHQSSGNSTEPSAATTFKYEEVDSEDPYCSSSSAPEISVFSAEGEDLEIDICTGLPKLPVELPPISPEPTRKQPSALRMSTSPGKRKSVTFEPAAQASSPPPANKVC